MIGCGWYGKCDLLRLIQVSPVEVVSLCDVDRRMLSEAADLVVRAPGVPQEAAHLQRLSHHARREGSRYRPGRHARPLARAAHDRRRQGRRACLLPEADLRGRGGRPGDARRRAQIQTRRADRHAAAQHAAPDRSARPASCSEGKLGKVGLVEIYCYYHMRNETNPPDTAPPDYLDYNMWTGPAPMRPYNTHRASARLARLHGVRQRHRRRHVRPHARHDALDDGPRLAEAHRIERRHPGIQGQQGEHHRHAARHLRLRRSQGRLAAPLLGHGARPQVSLGRHLLRRQGHAAGERDELRFHARRPRRSRHPQGRHLRTGAVSRGQDREGPGAALRARHSRPHEGSVERHRHAAAARWPISSRDTSPPRAAFWPTCR